MSDQFDPNIFQREAAQDVFVALAESSVAATLAAGLLKPGTHGADEAIAVYRHVLARIREGGGL